MYSDQDYVLLTLTGNIGSRWGYSFEATDLGWLQVSIERSYSWFLAKPWRAVFPEDTWTYVLRIFLPWMIYIDVFLYKWVLGKLPVFQGIIPSWVSKPIQGGAGKNAKSSLSLSNCTTGAMVFFGHGIFYRWCGTALVIQTSWNGFMILSRRHPYVALSIGPTYAHYHPMRLWTSKCLPKLFH